MNNKAKVPGVMTLTANASCSGAHITAKGLGTTSIGIHPSSNDGCYTDLLEIVFQDVSVDKYKELMQASESRSMSNEEQMLFVDTKRRLSRKQAAWLAGKVTTFIQGLGYIPADDEI